MLDDEKITIFEVDLEHLQPSQLYIASEKLAAVERAMAEVENWHYAPVPVKRLASRTVLIDGHTRVFAAFRQGKRSFPAYWEIDELDWEAYQICVQWCLDQGIFSIADLTTRIVPEKQYEALWLKRCRTLHHTLALQRSKRQGATICSNVTLDNATNAASEAVRNRLA